MSTRAINIHTHTYIHVHTYIRGHGILTLWCQYSLCQSNITFYALPLALLPIRRVVAPISSGPAWNPFFDKEHVCNKIFWVVDGTLGQNWLFGMDLDFDQMGRPVLVIYHSRSGKRLTHPPVVLDVCMHHPMQFLTQLSVASHWASTQIKIERPLLVGEKTCYLGFFHLISLIITERRTCFWKSAI